MATHPAAQFSYQDPVLVDSHHYAIEFETERLRVLRIKYGPHEKSIMHHHPALIVVMLTDSYLRMNYPDGTSEEIVGKAGQLIQTPATEHLPENLSDQVFEAILIEMKG